METTCSFKAIIGFQWAIIYHLPENRTLHNHICEQPKSHKDIIVRLIISQNFLVPESMYFHVDIYNCLVWFCEANPATGYTVYLLKTCQTFFTCYGGPFIALCPGNFILLCANTLRHLRWFHFIIFATALLVLVSLAAAEHEQKPSKQYKHHTWHNDGYQHRCVDGCSLLDIWCTYWNKGYSFSYHRFQ